jgi:agmatinase
MKTSEIIKSVGFPEADVVLLCVPNEETVSGDSGTVRAPEEICRQLREQVEEFDLLVQRRICGEVKIIQELLGISRSCDSDKMVNAVYFRTKHLHEQGKFPVILGGEHTVDLGAIKAAKEFFGDITVVQFDAHADMREHTGDYEEIPRVIAHSTVMRRAHELGCRIVQVGIRSMSEMEHDFLAKNGLMKNVIPASHLAGPCHILDKIETDMVYLTVDVDVFSGADFPGTGTFEPGGISWDKFMNIAEYIFKKRKVVGFGVVEVIPREIDTRTEYAAAKLVYNLIGRKFCK